MSNRSLLGGSVAQTGKAARHHHPKRHDDDSVQQIVYAPGTGVVATPAQSFVYDAVYPRISTVTTTGGTSTSCLGTTTFNYNAVAGGTTLGQGMLANTAFTVGTGSGYTLTPSFQFAYDALGRALTTNIGAANANTTTINNYDDFGCCWAMNLARDLGNECF